MLPDGTSGKKSQVDPATLDKAAEFLIRRPAEIAREEVGGGPVEVYHYSQALRVQATNRVFRVASGRARL